MGPHFIVGRTGETWDEPQTTIPGLQGKFVNHYVTEASSYSHLSRLMRKPTICICENKGADQLRGNREVDQRLCFRYSDSTVPLLLISKISSI